MEAQRYSANASAPEEAKVVTLLTTDRLAVERERRDGHVCPTDRYCEEEAQRRNRPVDGRRAHAGLPRGEPRVL